MKSVGRAPTIAQVRLSLPEGRPLLDRGGSDRADPSKFGSGIATIVTVAALGWAIVRVVERGRIDRDRVRSRRHAIARAASDAVVTVDRTGAIMDADTVAGAGIRDFTAHHGAEENVLGLLEAAPDAIAVVDEKGVIVVVNARAEGVFGYSREELVGRPIELLVPERYRRGHPALRDRYMADPQPRQIGVGADPHAQRKDGSEFPVEIAVNPIQTEDGLLVVAAVRDITERREMERATAHLAAIVESSADAIIGLSAQATIGSWNHGAERLYGYSAEEAIGQPINVLASPGHDRDQEHVSVALAGETVRFESEDVRRDGSRITTSVTISPVRDATGAIAGVSCIAHDITARKRIENELVLNAKVERALREVASASAARGVSGAGVAELVAVHARKLLGAVSTALVRFDPEGFTVLGSSGAVPMREGLVDGQSAIAQVARTGTMVVIEEFAQLGADLLELSRRSGCRGAAAMPVFVHGRLWGAIGATSPPQGFAADAAQLLDRFAQLASVAFASAEAWERLRGEQAILAAAQNSTRDAIHIVDTEGRVVRANDAFVSMHTLEGREHGPSTISETHGATDVRTPDGEAVPIDEWPPSRALRGETGTIELSVRQRGSDQPWRDVDYSFAPVRAGDEISGAIVIGRDVTALKTAERATARLAAIVDSSDDAIIAETLEGRIISWNHGAERLYGYSPAEVIGQHISTISLPDQSEEMARLLARVAAGERVSHFETTRRHKDGALVDVSLTVSPIRNRRGEVVGASAIGRDIGERKRAERVRERALADLEEAHRIAKLGSWTWDPRSDEATWSAQMYEIFGRDPSDGPAAGEVFFAYAHPEDRPRVSEDYARAFAGGSVFDMDYRIVSGDGAQRVLHALGREDPSNPGCYLGTVQDVTEQRAAEVALRDAEERFRRAFEEAPIGMALISLDGRVEHANAALGMICSRTHNELEGCMLRELLDPGDADGINEAFRALAAGDIKQLAAELRLVPADGAPVDILIHGTVLRYGADPPDRLLCQFQDITDRKRYESQLQFMADHDPLTGLFNRRKFEAELDRHVAQVKRYGPSGALLMLDLDNFKSINDTLGHSAGDELIVSIAGVLRQRLRSADILARIGGDEFAVLLPMADQGEATQVAAALISAIRTNTTLLGGEHKRVTSSIGIAMFDGPPESLSSEGALIGGDLAMYDAKEAGRDSFAAYASSEQRGSQTQARLTWVTRLERALGADRLVLAAQPILDLHTGHIAQHELLVRMLDEDDHLILPGAFLGIAERFGLIGRLDEWVVTHAIDLLEQRPDLRLHVNISGKSLGDHELPESSRRSLARSPGRPHQPDLRSHRDSGRRQHRECPDVRAPAARSRLPPRSGRLRRWLRLVLLPEAPPLRLRQDRR